MYEYIAPSGVKVTSTVKPNPPSKWDSTFWHTPLSWSLWARKIRRDFCKKRRWAR